MEIRKIKVEDALQYNNYLQSVLSETDYLTSVRGTFRSTVDQTKEIIEKQLINNRYINLVAINDQEIIGNLTLSANPKQKEYHVASFGISVRKAYYQQGIASALLARGIEEARAIQVKRIELEVVEENIPAIQLYQKFGFIKEGIRNKAFYINGKYHNLFYMYLWLD